MERDLSILIPARNEEFLQLTVEDILKNIHGNTEIIVILDGYFTEIPQHERLIVVYNPISLGQRAATNQAARLSSAKYLMKVDAHCAFDEGFDIKLMADMQDDWTVVPTMKNLHVFDWVCEDGHRRYQGPSGGCHQCGKPTHKHIVWNPKPSPNSSSYCFDSEPHFQYFKAFEKRPEGKGDITPSMSLQGSCFMLTRDKYWELNISDESFGSWGSQGIEVACKTWLSGGQVMVNKKTWYAHLFRTQGGDFGFPYPQSGNQVSHAKQHAKQLFFDNKWEKQIYPLSWLLEKFWPVPGWSDEQLEVLKAWPLQKKMSRGIIYYTDNQLNLKIAKKVQKQIRSIGLPIVSASLKPMKNMGKNIHMKLERGYLTMFKQILAALEASEADIIYFCEHDVLYPKEHFEFIPSRDDTFYYDTHVYKLREDGKALWVENCRQVSGIVVKRETALIHYRERVAYIEAHGFPWNMGFEPGTHGRITWQHQFRAESFMSEVPMVDIRHTNNLTASRWNKEQFRNQKYTQGWKFVDEIPGWGKIVL